MRFNTRTSTTSLLFVCLFLLLLRVARAQEEIAGGERMLATCWTKRPHAFALLLYSSPYSPCVLEGVACALFTSGASGAIVGRL